MSLWSKIGLADAATLSSLREEILTLRQENTRLYEAQSKQMQKMYDSNVTHLQGYSESVEKKLAFLGEELQNILPALEENLRINQQEVLSSGVLHRDLIMQQLSVLQKNQEIFKENVSSLKAMKEQALVQITEILKEMKAVQDQVDQNMHHQYSELNKASKIISEELDFLRKGAELQGKDTQKIVEQLNSGQREREKLLGEVENVGEDISFLKIYTESLWEAMKLVWINELIDEANNK